MAKQVYERLVDDLDGSEATQSVQFGLDGNTYRVDLNDKHADDLRYTLGPFLEAARRVRTVRAARGGVVGDKDRNRVIRAWALECGVELPTRGRISLGVQAAYDAGDVPALYAATGLEMDEPTPARRRRAAAGAVG